MKMVHHYVSIFSVVGLSYLFYFGSKNSKFLDESLKRTLRRFGLILGEDIDSSMYTGSIYNSYGAKAQFKNPSSGRKDYYNTDTSNAWDKYKRYNEFCHCWE